MLPAPWRKWLAALAILVVMASGLAAADDGNGVLLTCTGPATVTVGQQVPSLTEGPPWPPTA